ncbi:hypothetical protein D3C86_1607610 [compost metagenome]
MAASWASNWPYWNSETVSGSARIASARAHGNTSTKHSRSPQSRMREYSWRSLLAYVLARVGSRIVPNATPSTPDGNSIRRSA